MTDSPFTVERSQDGHLEEPADLPPVVARMVVEIRSDGSRTVARGALEDLATGQRIALRAEAGSLTSLVSELGKNLLTSPLLLRETMRNTPQLMKEAVRSSPALLRGAVRSLVSAGTQLTSRGRGR